jgi:hypothetical protein
VSLNQLVINLLDAELEKHFYSNNEPPARPLRWCRGFISTMNSKKEQLFIQLLSRMSGVLTVRLIFYKGPKMEKDKRQPGKDRR